MAETPSAFLVIRRDDGYGDVFPLTATQGCTLGRAPSNRVVLKDDLCSREHAEVGMAHGRWRVRDLNSLNGVRVNGERIQGEAELHPGDEVRLGRTDLLFVEDMNQLPEPAGRETPTEHSSPEDSGVSIKKRLGQTRFLVPVTPETEQTGAVHPSLGPPSPSRHALSNDLSLLYRLALQMGEAETVDVLCKIVLEGLLEAIPAEVGAILTVPKGREVPAGQAARGTELEVAAYRHRSGREHRYKRVSEFVSNEVLATREAILAEDIERNRHLKARESISDMGATSLICAPILFEQKVLGLIHLYCVDPRKALDGEDLEFSVAVAKQLGIVLYQMQRSQSLSAANRSLRDQLKIESELVGESPAIREIESIVGRAASTKLTCLIRGESGSGKELVARALHYSSPRRDGPFVCLNCAALTETLLESELFGHEKGAFTGATERKIGKFESAHHGTIFLDEIGEMSFGTQAKLLRVLEEHPFERVGGSHPIQVDVRVVAATNQPLEDNVRGGAFRRDLFYRLQVVEIRVPPLRERKSDIRILARHFLHRYVGETGRRIKDFTDSALHKMEEHDWPGNVRELKNVVERAVALGNGPLLDVGDIWLSTLDLLGNPTVGSAAAYEAVTLEEMEKRHILATLEHTGWNKSATAAILQIERSTLDRKIAKYKLARE
jgi:Nif-specific regulatory protein